jgi:Fe-S oxidoreductase
LQSLNYEIILLTGCCGLAALSSGQREPARQAARSLGRSWQKYNLTRIVTLCTSCAHALAQEYPALGVATIGAEVIDINSLLSEYPQLGAGRAVFTQAYLHVSCHLEQAEALRSWLLEAGIAGLTIIDACCGGGGLLPFNSLQLSQAIPPRLPDSSLPLLTTCSGCYAQWLQVYPGKVIHPLEALRLE